jgi:signal transduction histidine kinase
MKLKLSEAPPSFFRSLVFIALLAVLTLPLYTMFFLSPSFVSYVTQHIEKDAVKVALHMESKLIPEDSKVLSKAILTEDVLKKLLGTVEDFSFMHNRILFPDGKILFSSNETEAKEFINLDPVISILLQGKNYSKFIKKGSPDLGGTIMPTDTIETYVPIMRDNDLIGVFEIYTDIGEEKKQLAEVLNKFYFTLFPIVLIYLCSVVVSCRRANRNIQRRLEAERELLQKSIELEDKNQDLTELIILCQDRKLKLEEEQKAHQHAQEQINLGLRHREQQRKEFSRHLVMTQEEERSRIARELHDETAQTLTAASLNFATLGKMLEGNDKVGDVVNNLQNLCRKMNQDLYRLVHDLRPAQLDDLGLIPALHYLSNEGQDFTGIDVTFRVNGKAYKMEPFVETVIFRIVQEALTNVTRHAETDRAWVELNFEENQSVVLRIHDEGKGFHLHQQKEDRTGWGLVGMSERVESINGTLTIDSSPGEGTTVEVVVTALAQD